MNKVLFWLSWGLAFLIINLSTLPIAAFILYGPEDEAGVFSTPFIRVVGLFFIINLITLQMFIAGRKENKRGFAVGLSIAVLQVAGIIIFMSTISTTAVLFVMLVLVIAAVLLVKEIRRRAYY
ncbi:hypothetical protein [Pseudobacillus wudalianchiensis]|uniref:Uncharacterized protein n=1 Tax=Pseudobacillus wudalianchiensis TaxID=1743143 RepID=A0A1B9AAQ3_9BACI|nr:hypothetical protein [Bacillus wudalianchiensis]OCA80841.1 hypothetical protein A8F95_17180 [Bacillus wudalianchiensis]